MVTDGDRCGHGKASTCIGVFEKVPAHQLYGLLFQIQHASVWTGMAVEFFTVYFMAESASLTVAQCTQHCLGQMGTNHFAVEFGRECWCSNYLLCT
ncbi:hypothetical protein ColLi_12443 [Colletotrichum liriopes]|uniref:WSC domain-containing protein n=1 Tax=Colletotrichum liriopes TaxID=708192 RepID=A0AA37LXX1_9PEZI|nr:hypothetical protein ColLi_12443 [Colletotrichum liriopes]